MALALPIDPSEVERIEIVRLPYVTVNAEMRVRFRYEAGVVDERGFETAMRRYERDLRQWRVDHAEWQAREMRKVEQDEARGDRRPLAHSAVRMGIGGPPKPDQPAREAFAEYRVTQGETKTDRHRFTGRLFDPNLAFPRRSERELANLEASYLFDSMDALSDLPIVDPVEQELDAQDVLRDLGSKVASAAASAAAAAGGTEFYRRVEVAKIEWLDKASRHLRHVVRAQIRRGDQRLLVEVRLIPTPDGNDFEATLASRLIDKKKVVRRAAGAVGILGVVAACAAFLIGRPSDSATSPGPETASLVALQPADRQLDPPSLAVSGEAGLGKAEDSLAAAESPLPAPPAEGVEAPVGPLPVQAQSGTTASAGSASEPANRQETAPIGVADALELATTDARRDNQRLLSFLDAAGTVVTEAKARLAGQAPSTAREEENINALTRVLAQAEQARDQYTQIGQRFEASPHHAKALADEVRVMTTSIAQLRSNIDDYRTALTQR